MVAPAELDTALARLRPLDPDSLDLAGVTAASRAAACVQAWLDSVTAALAARTDALHQQGRSAPADEVLARSGCRTRAEGRRIRRRSRILGQVAALADALDDQRIGSAHVDAVANVSERLDDATRAALFNQGELLASTAATLTPEQFGRWCRRLVERLEHDAGIERFERQRRATSLRRWIDSASGMYVLHGEFDPETGARIFSALDAELDARWRAQHPGDEVVPSLARSNPHLAAHALAGLVAGGHAAARPGTAEVIVLIDLASLQQGLHEHSVCELHDGTEIPVGTARRLACEAEILPVVLGSSGEVLDLGRRQRLANRAQRRALRAMYRSCAWVGCTVPFHHCEIHHLVPWEHTGATDLANLVPLCHEHHHLAHEGRWRLHLRPDRTLTIHRPDGTHHAEVPLERHSCSRAVGPPDPRSDEPADPRSDQPADSQANDQPDRARAASFSPGSGPP